MQRGRVVPTVVALLLLPLAGCITESEAELPAGLPAAPATWKVRVSGSMHFEPACFGGCQVGTSAVVFEVPWNTTLVQVKLRIEGPPEFDWAVRCLPDQCDGGAPRGHASGGVADVEADLVASGGSALVVDVTGPDTAYTELGPATSSPFDAFVSGHAVLKAIQPGPPESLPFTGDGHTGPCEFNTEPACSGIPGGTDIPLPLVRGYVRWVNVTMTWDDPLAPELAVRLEAPCPTFDDACEPFWAEVTGASPLSASFEVERLGSAMRLSGNPPTVEGFRTAGLRTPVHVEGTVEFLPSPSTEEGGERGLGD